MDAAEARAGHRRVRPAPALRYRHKMTKSHSKVVLRKETIRALSGIDLARAIGGANSDAPIVAEMSDIRMTCLNVAIEQARNK
jgi:hypothetical protein